MVAAISENPSGAGMPEQPPIVKARSDSLEFLCAVYQFAPRRHLLLMGIAAASAPVLYLTLETPKWIVNGALAGGEFSCFGADLDPVTALAILSCVQLMALATLNGLKFTANLLSANLGEMFLRSRRLRLLRRWRSQASDGREKAIAPMLTQELEAVAGFAGSMIATPFAQIIALLTVLGFLLAQDWRLAFAAVALTPAQAFLAPYLMRRIGALKATRIEAVREMCAGLSEEEGHLPGFSSSLKRVRQAQNLRFEIHRRKFLMKALHNIIGHLTPLLYLSVGGYLVIEGELSIGALVAALAAYREASGPLRELFSLYLRWADARVRYKALRRAIA